VVLGDLTLDHYLVGDAGRISREYPVVILTHERDEYRLGGAANTVANLASLGAEVLPVGRVGDDPEGDELEKLLARIGCETEGVLRDPGTRTVTKTRIVAGGTGGGGLGQHLLRVDRLGAGAPPPEAERKILERLQQAAPLADGFVLSDYGHGALTEAVAAGVARCAGGRYVGLDSRHRLLDFRGLVTAATPNLEETAEASGLRLPDEASIQRAGRGLLSELGAEALLVTRGGDGMSLFQPEEPPIHIPVANRSEVFDVTGAGDAVVAAFTLARLAGGSFEEAARLANVAGGLSVRRAGPTPVGREELRAALGAS
jgi:rfaE bifunctional protein kinase chain/domain